MRNVGERFARSPVVVQRILVRLAQRTPLQSILLLRLSPGHFVVAEPAPEPLDVLHDLLRGGRSVRSRYRPSGGRETVWDRFRLRLRGNTLGRQESGQARVATSR